ncbi:Extra-large guanine nucleotide-binding protein 2 [Castilleja foliolosa]|uniref:Extra-large guanine nucleotide-binding protein 2 n=1 Tax=Castilleja foliolosa TaxID=1961234 RepID=A0ABD3BNV9_9LAMI
MTSMSRSILPGSSARTEDPDDDYNVNYSLAIEYKGPPVSRDIPRVVPIDVRRIPTASIAASAVVMKNFSLPIIQPILKSDQSSKKSSGELNSDSGGHFSSLGSSVRVHYSRKSENAAQASTSSGTSGFFDCRADSVSVDDESKSKSGVLYHDVDDLDDESNSYFSCTKSRPQQLSSQDDGVADEPSPSNRDNRVPAVTFRELPSSKHDSDYDDRLEMYPERPVVPNDGKKGLCYKCGKTNRFSEREICIVCGAKYCRKCVLRAMGCMPEGRKCITCIGYRIDESKRGSLGKCSRMLKKLLNDDVMKRIMSAELSCEVNQLPPHLIYVNGKPLSIEELVSLQSCLNPPKKLKPGKYWYDKVSGFWGKDGEKPSQIISPQLALGYQILQGASNGDTNVVINNREITKPELWMLQAAGINCEGNPHFWVTADGSCQHEGMKNVLGNLWERKRVKLLCAALCLPYPSDTSNAGGGDVDNDKDKDIINMPEHKTMNKILLVGCDQSGTSTIFKQAKTVYGVPFSADEKQNIKFMIQRNVYHYLCILLEGHARFEEEFFIEMRRQRAEEPGPSDYSEQFDESNIYSFTPRLKAFSDWLLQVMISGNLEVIFPAATREYSPLVVELWKDKAFQATYKRRNELLALPRVANYFLDRAVEISRTDYEPSEMDILYAEGVTSSNAVVSMEFYFPEPSRDGYMESSNYNSPPICYQLIRVNANSLGENCKWLTMFEDVDLVVYCVSLTDYDEYHEDINGVRTNKMLTTKMLFESIVTHETFAGKEFHVVLNKFDLLEEMIERVPLSQCVWFEDFHPVMSGSNNNSPLAQRAFHYIAVKFKRLFEALTERKLFVSRTTGLEPDSVDRALKYCREIMKWSDEIQTVSANEWSSESMEPSTSV